MSQTQEKKVAQLYPQSLGHQNTRDILKSVFH